MKAVKSTWINRRNSFQKLIISLCLAVVATSIFSLCHQLHLAVFVFGWDIFSLSLLSLTWITFFTAAPSEIRMQSKKQDESRFVVFVLVLAASCVSMMAVVVLLTSKKGMTTDHIFPLSIAFACMTFSWFLMHTIFTLRYAHLYYADHKDDADVHIGGLNFPDENRPDFLDFAYFSFTLGMTFQVSDVAISNRQIRRLVLFHSLIAFAYNAVIIALTVNFIAGLGG